jgi:hypothetical protein
MAPIFRTNGTAGDNSRSDEERSAGDNRRAHGAARFLQMPAILEAAADADLMDLLEAAFSRAHQTRRRREIADSRRVDDRRMSAERIPARGGGGVPPLIVAGQFGGLRCGRGRQGVHQRRLADA